MAVKGYQKVEERLDADNLHAALSYDRETGLFTWKIACGRARIGMVAGRLSNNGYIQIGIERSRIYAHRLAWFFETGKWPEYEIDHVNNIKDDNRFANLRSATPSQNIMNTRRRVDNTSGAKGVCWYKAYAKWRARIYVGKKEFLLGYFTNKDDAVAAYKNAAEKFHKEFART